MIEIFIIFGLILLNGLFAMAEIALVSSRKARLEAEANKGVANARHALELANKPDTFISTVQLIITLIALLTGIFSGEDLKGDLVAWLHHFPSISHYANGIGTAIVVICITFITLIVGELVPKRIGMSNPERIAKLVAAPMQVVSTVVYPFIWLLTKTTNLLTQLLGIKDKDNSVTEDEIKAIINEGTEQGTIDEAEQEIIERVFHLSDRSITSLMTHRSDIEWLDVHQTVGEIKQSIDDNMHSLYPVCEGNIDTIRGYITVKDLFLAKDEMPVTSIMKTPLYVPENNTAYQVLEKLKGTKAYHCFIVNEYGDVEGLITLNDILDAIVGDVLQPSEEDHEITQRKDGSFLIDAQLPFYDFLKYFHKTEWMTDDEQEFDTLAGFILHHMKVIPITGDTLTWRGFDFEIIDMDHHRIDKILVTVKPVSPI